MKKIALTVVLSALALVLIFFAVIFFLLRSRDFQQKIIEQVEKQFGNQLDIGSFEVALYPPISLVIRDVTLKNQDAAQEMVLKSPKVEVYLKLLPLLLSRVELGKVHADDTGCQVQWKARPDEEPRTFTLAGFDIRLSNVQVGQPVTYSLKGGVFGPAGNVQASGTFRLGMTEKGPVLAAMKSEFHFKDVDFPQVFPLLLPGSTFQVKEGVFGADGEINWAPDKFAVKAGGSVKQMVYALSSTPAKTSSPADFGFKANGDWNAAARQFHLSDFSLSSPYGDFLLNGSLGENAEIPYDLELKSGNLNLDRLPEFLVPLDKAIPNKFGFSGQMEMDLFIKGKPESISITGASDLSASLLSYASYFNKPKKLPLTVQMDLTLQKGKILQGDVGLKLKEMSLKGSVVDFDVTTGDGELTFLTNKFSLEGWEAIFQPISKYPMKGFAKILLNAKGNLSNLEEMSYNGTLTLEETQAVYEELPIRNLNATLELTNRRAATGKVDFVAQSSPIHIEYIRNIPPYESLTVKCTSTEWYPHEMVAPLAAMAAQWRGPEGKKAVEDTGKVLSQIVSETQPLKNVSLSFSWIGTLVSVQEAYFYLYDGLVRGAGEVEFGVTEPHYNFGIQVEKLNLSPLVNQMARKSLFQGEFYLLANFEGDQLQGDTALDHLRGRGEMKVVDGVINNLDFLTVIGGLPQFVGILPFAKGATEFSDLHTDFVVENGKVITDEVVMISPNFSANANGFCTFDGTLNYQVNLKLNDILKQKVSETAGQNPADIRLQVYGRIDDIKYGFDKSQVIESVEKIITDKFKKMKNKMPDAKPVAAPDTISQGTIEEAGVQFLRELMGKKTGKESEDKK